jgi:hypothetical protein
MASIDRRVVRGSPVGCRIAEVLDEHDIEWEVRPGGKHLCFHFEHAGRAHRFPFSTHSVESRARSNAESAVRRIIAQSSEKHMPSMKVVEFRGASIPTVEIKGEPHVALKPVVEAMGLDWEGQHKRAKGDLVLSPTISVTEMVGKDGKRREMAILPLRFLQGFLFGIDASRVREEVRAGVIAYQRECYDALHAYWTDGVAVRAPEFDEKARRVIGGIVKAVLHKELDDLRAGVDLALEAVNSVQFKSVSPTFDLAGTVTALQVSEMAGVALRCRGLTPAITYRLRAWCAERAIQHFQTPRAVNPSQPGRFSRDAASAWLADGGAAWVIRFAEQQRYVKGVRGSQGRLRLVKGGS